jgi:hypothetical protein
MGTRDGEGQSGALSSITARGRSLPRFPHSRKHVRSRDYLSLLEERHRGVTDPSAAELVRCIRRYVDEHLDPLASPPAMPADPEIRAEDLKPFLGHVSPYGPQR